MEKNGIYTWWHYFRKGEVTGQVATLITLAIAIIFLFVAVTLNISRVSQKKTATAQAADAAALKLASYLGSYANQLSWKFLDGGTEKCQRRWGTFWKILATIVLVVIAVLFPPLAPLAITGAVVSGTSAALNEFVFEPKIAERMQRQLNKLSLKDNLTEQAIMFALRRSVDDPVKVVDVYDYDEDGNTTDKISRFSQWYTERVNMLTEPELARRAKISQFLPVLENFAQAGDEFRRSFSEDATRALIVEEQSQENTQASADPQSEPVDILAGENGELITLLEDLKKENLQFSFWKEDVDENDVTTFDQVDQLSADLNLYYLWEDGLLNEEFESIVRMYETWAEQLYDYDAEKKHQPEDEEGESWYETWAAHIEAIENWQPELSNAISQLENLIAEESDPERIAHLRNLQQRTSQAIQTLDNFQDKLSDFNTQIVVFYRKSDEDSVNKRLAVYSWHDSLGWHHVQVEVSKVKMPYLKVKRKFMWICLYLKRHSGDATVKVTRFDEATAASFARRGTTPLWKFRYAKDAQAQGQINPATAAQALAYGITSEAQAHYSYRSLPRLVKVK